MARALGLSAGRHRLAGLLCMCWPPPPRLRPDRLRRAGRAAPGAPARRPDLRWQLAFCLLLGPVLMLAADILARCCARRPSC